ncbi:IncF plasmid conjugative transfer protein TrbI (plasmid) [Paramixta manurensis]|uniref:IncF plasmid conjugative transfer protein TrbI n=1 Tax=Paramixta manurensis TaxID=2740817 RepID=A0A6M8UQZ8_9GAMM|nr:IncF plasmid conjugative transfer protein TrbI [Erwiniaceae bacterium PD-1]
MQNENAQPTPEEAAEAGAPVSRGHHFLKNRALRTGAAALLLMIWSAGVSLLFTQYSQPDAVVFDMKGTIDAFKQQTAQTALPEAAAKNLTEVFSHSLNNSLTDWQRQHGGVILVKGAVVSGMPDITPEIQADIARQMQGAR